MKPDSRWADDPLLAGLEVYRVGGAVRDRLLGRAPAENDFVVVGASPAELERRGFRAVGRDFPVFLHPETGEEFALARTERKSGRGYAGFVFHTGPDVGLTDDLRRRDLTINAIAEDRNGRLIDPFGGRDDLDAGVLRHVSDAFVEDPLRLIRLARFATRLADFRIAPETMTLARRLVASGEVDHLVAERVWQETARALMHDRPSRFFEVLRAAGALERIAPEIDALWGVPQAPEHHPEIDTGVHTMMVLDLAASLDAPLAVRFACLVHDLGKPLTPAGQLPRHHGHEKRGLKPIGRVCQRLRVPNDCRDLGLIVGEHHLVCHRALELRGSTVVRMFHRLDAFRRPERFERFLLACECDRRGREGRADEPYPQAAFLQRALAAARAIGAAALKRRGLSGKALGEALDAERAAAVARVRESHTG
ncbi:MAG: multifunctional CCA addition/repair protein [Wenzhouxiangellaceae bacterium]|nr:multifunctional CCA addition/repair protein [Wenzhouxiangellaceae bacterium]